MSTMGGKFDIVKPDVKWQDITEGGIMEQPGNAKQFNTGDWRSQVAHYFCCDLGEW